MKAGGKGHGDDVSPDPFADDVLDVRWYREAQRVADVLGQDAATAMLQRERHKRMMVRIAAEQVRQKALRRIGWGPWLRVRLFHAGLACVGLALANVALTAGFGPEAAQSAMWALYVAAIVFTCVSPAV